MREYRIDKTNKIVVFTFDYDKEIIKRIKSCSFSSHWNASLKYWAIPITEYSKLRIIKIIKDFDFIPSKIEKIKLEKFDYSMEDLRLDKLTTICKKREFTYTPRLYQYEALNYSLEKGNVIIGDDVGLGKTFEAILYAELIMSFPCLVIAPASVKYNWAEKWEEITGNKRKVSVIESRKKNNWNADVVVINYDIIGKKQGKGATIKFPELKEVDWKMIIADEAHFLKSSKSQRTKAAFKIMKGDARIQLLTGTATMNKPVELWNLLRLVKCEDKFARNWRHFTEKYCGGYQSKYGWKSSGATNTLELNKLLRETCYIRREKRDVLKELPPVMKQVLTTKISNRKEYEFAESDFINFIRETKGEEKAEKAMEAENLVALSTMRRLVIDGKIKAIEQYLKDWKEVSTEKLLIFGLHREPLNYLSEKFECKLIAGGVSSKKKQEIVKGFKDSEDLFLFANMQSAGTGVDGLQHASSNMLIIELPWRPSDLEQVIGRLDRLGQELSVMVTFMLSDKTIDSDMWEMLAEKELVIEAVNKGIDIEKEKSGLRMITSKILKRVKNGNKNISKSN